MNWLKNKIRRWLSEYDEVSSKATSHWELNSPANSPVMHFRIYSAENGKIIEFNRYDSVKDRTITKNYIIGKEEDVGEKVSKYIKVELLR